MVISNIMVLPELTTTKKSKMVFFDLGVPYLDPDKDHAARKAARLKVVVKAMELGYSGVAYDRSIRGVMSNKDLCTIPTFPLSSLLKVAPTLSASVRFHRQLLGVPLSAPFRQYKRLTVAADNFAHVTALNSGNPVLRTYDLVAVRPLSQAAFDQACTAAEVDLIAIDFSQKMPFRLKLPMVKAAVERGICFEIAYSHFISNVHSRRQMLSGAKLLIDWTRGKNLIFSSAATSADELRGPYDVANLSSLLGLSTEQAKAAISKNCRALLDRALRKKQFYKEAIRIENLSPADQLNSRHKLLSDRSNWDPISSGDGDLLPLEDFVKQFSDAIKVPKNYFDELHTFSNNNAQQDPISCRQENPIPADDSNTATQKLESCFTTNKALGGGRLDTIVFTNDGIDLGSGPSFSTPTKLVVDVVSVQNELGTSDELDLTGTSALTVTDSLLKAHIFNASDKSGSPNDSITPTPGERMDSLNFRTRDVCCWDEIHVFSCNIDSSMDCTPVFDITDISDRDKGKLEPSKELKISHASPMETDKSSIHCIDIGALAAQEVVFSPSIVTVEESAAAAEDKKKSTLSSCSTILHECVMDNTNNHVETNSVPQIYNRTLHKGVQNIIFSEQEDGAWQVTDVTLVGGSDELKVQGNSVLALPAVDVSIKENWIEEQGCRPSITEALSNKQKTGKGRFIQKLQQEALRIPSKGLFKPLLFRRKIHRLKGSRKQCSAINHDIKL